MRRLEFLEPGRLEWREAPEPSIEAGDNVLVRPVAVATCDLDRLIVRGRAPVSGPFPFGHECVAEVVDVGDEVRTVAPGDLVSVPFQISCGSCGRCVRGHTGHCETVPRMSMFGLGPLSGADWGGFLADLVRVPFADHMLVPVPDGVEPVAVASASDNIVDAWRTVAPQLEAEPGAAVLIVASNASIGLYATSIALTLGASRVDWVGGGDWQRERAVGLGATVFDRTFPDRLGPYPITVDASADRAGLACAIRSTEPDGTCTSIGIYFEPETPMPLLEMYTKGITFHTGRVHARPLIPQVLDLVRQGRLRPELVTHRTVTWDEADAAVADLQGKLVVARGGSHRNGST